MPKNSSEAGKLANAKTIWARNFGDLKYPKLKWILKKSSLVAEAVETEQLTALHPDESKV